MRVIVQIWDAENQEATRRVGVTSPRIASKIAETSHDGKTARIVPKAYIKAPRSDVHPVSRAGGGKRGPGSALATNVNYPAGLVPRDILKTTFAFMQD